MPTSIKTLTGIFLVAGLAGCTNKVEIPALAGPSTLGYSIMLTSNTTSLIQDGVSSATIEITGRDSNGQPTTGRPLRAAIFVGGVIQDYGTLSTKSPITGGTLRYTSPPASPLAGGQVAQVVTIAVTPLDSGDFLNEMARGVDIQLIPQGVILPTNPNLVVAFTVSPASPMVFSTATFDASSTTNAGVACLHLCTYAWNFGDGTTGAGISATHDYRTVGTYLVTLTVTDARGAQLSTVQSVVVSVSTPPTASFTYSPTPAYVNQDIFFNAEASRPANGRTITNYGWNLGDGRTASGYTIARSYPNIGVYIVTLRVTDDAGATATATQSVNVTSPTPVASFTVSPSPPTVGGNVTFNASASTGPSTISTYSWSFGSGSSPATASGQVVNTTYSTTGAKAVTLTITDSQGRTASVTQTVTVQ